VCGEALPISMASQCIGDELPEAAICGRGEAPKEVVEHRTPRIQKLQKCPARLAGVFHNEAPELFA
jgi:hypothetical protein